MSVSEPPFEEPQPEDPTVINTGNGGTDGFVKCERCGSTDVGFSVTKALLFCKYCRHEWQSENAVDAYQLNSPISELVGIHIGSGSAALIPGTDQVMTFKCSGCGAEVVIDTQHALQSRCHWCRQTLSVQEQIPNGAVPDAVLPFALPKEAAVQRIKEFVNKRKFFALRKFKAEFNAENVIGVYLPYMIVDINAKMSLGGVGEVKLRSYRVGSGDDARTVYDADVYQISRQFDLHIDDLTVESSFDKGNINNRTNTNNIINAIMPFDTQNIVKFDPNYLAGFSSEKRDTNVEDLSDLAALQASDVGRSLAHHTLQRYDRGVRWEQERFNVVGERWISAYLPVWIYSYYHKKSSGQALLHYIAVNGRTGETMGSVPINTKRLLVASAIAQLIGTIAFVLVW
ncbi:TFIIB-type zinc ribbon-containing protein [Timonella sp. A28]|uniref:TFIIB-type zinc ribbon-containing protein n=1 Tax=Timonella sp. A28 TaxID=3442640 RepID=UPI003EBE91DD